MKNRSEAPCSSNPPPDCLQLGQLPPSVRSNRYFYSRSHLKGREAGRSAGAGAHQVRYCDQPQDREGARSYNPAHAARSSERGYRIKAHVRARRLAQTISRRPSPYRCDTRFHRTTINNHRLSRPVCKSARMRATNDLRRIERSIARNRWHCASVNPSATGW